MNSLKPLVSVIITTRNEEINIRKCLVSLQSQTYGSIEIIVVDNGSEDRTKKIAREFRVSVYDMGPERSAQRNFGAKKAKGEYLLFLDADMILTPEVIQDCVRVINPSKVNNKNLLALVIPEKSIGMGFWAHCKALERSFYEGADWIEAARFFRKDVFEMLGGYDEKLTGPEDFDLPQRLKVRYGNKSIGRIREYIIHNEGRLTLGKTLKKKYYYGRLMWKYLIKFENSGVGLKQGNILFRYIILFLHPNKLLRHPVVSIGMFFMKTLEFIMLGFGFINGLILQ
jgi:glycosyltransferase involved in cell wall biosynthesis